MKMTAANILTLSRLVLTPVFLVTFVMGFKAWALVIFCVAGFTDLIDGTVARMTGQFSKSGALLDPLADKLLVESSFFALALAGFLPWWFFGIAFARDVMIVSGIFYLDRVGAELPYKPLWISKIATLFQIVVAVLGLVAWMSQQAATSSKAFEISVLIAAALIVASGFQYFRMGMGLLHKANRRNG
jgi:cardiolipin synthase (CMP-forming)